MDSTNLVESNNQWDGTFYGRWKNKAGQVMTPKWRIISLTMMGFSFVCISLSAASTHWRLDHEPWLDIDTTYGMWRICRDITFGATIDHQCGSSPEAVDLANNAEPWYQVFRGFLCVAMLLELIAFGLGIRTVTQIPLPEHDQSKPRPAWPARPANMVIPAILMLVGGVFALFSVGTFAVATHLMRTLFFPPNLKPIWARSWDQVWALAGSQPDNRVDTAEVTIRYGYSFAICWVGVLSSFLSFFLNLCARG